MDRQPTWTDFYEAGDCFVPNVCSPSDLVARHDNMDETVPHTQIHDKNPSKMCISKPLDRFEETCYVAIGTSAYHSLFKC